MAVELLGDWVDSGSALSWSDLAHVQRQCGLHANRIRIWRQGTDKLSVVGCLMQDQRLHWLNRLTSSL